MENNTKSIFDTIIAKIDESERRSRLDEMYAISSQTREDFIADAMEVAQTTYEDAEGIAKIIDFENYLKQREVKYWVVFNEATISSLKSLNGEGQTLNLFNLDICVFAKNEDEALDKAIDELWTHYGIEAHDVDCAATNELPVSYLNDKGEKVTNFNYAVAC